MRLALALVLGAVLISLAVLWTLPRATEMKLRNVSSANAAVSEAAGIASAIDSTSQTVQKTGQTLEPDLFSAFGMTRSRLLENGDVGAAIAAMRIPLQSAKLVDLISIAQNQSFSEQEAPLLHLLALKFSERADSASVAKLAENYFASGSEVERGQLCLLVREIKHEEGLTALASLISSPYARNSSPLDPLMQSAAIALAAAPDPRWLAALLATAASGPQDLQTSLFDGLRAVSSPQVLPLLFEMIDGTSSVSGDPRFREVGVRLLGQIRIEEARDKLEQLKQAGDTDVAQWATESALNLRRSAPGLYSAIGQ